jgi:nitroimidazol reductase NimA-like FMN-containing flavoprotein (pyridoxamine 5'-phosphate oxidase superfamily)
MTSDTALAAELQPDACWRLLRESEVGRLAVVVGDHPEIFPVNYAVDAGTIVVRTSAGTKLAALAGGPLAAFEIDGYDAATQVVWSVVVKGRAEVVHGVTQLLDTADLPVYPWQPARKNQFVRIVADEVTGRCFRRANNSYWQTEIYGGHPQAAE